MATITCPACGHRSRSKRVLYGLPTPEAMDAANRGEFILGGCMPDVPVVIPCSSCGSPIDIASGIASEPPDVGRGVARKG